MRAGHAYRRPAALQHLLDAAEIALGKSSPAGSEAERAVRLAFGRLNRTAGKAGRGIALRLPVCDRLASIYAAAGKGPRANVARAFAAIEPSLLWARRFPKGESDDGLWDGHANAMIVGPNALEERADVWVGVSLMAPGVLYGKHDHAPEEVYLPLTPGEWWNEDMDWTAPGPDGVIYNRPGICHAMRSGTEPFLALWVLPI